MTDEAGDRDVARHEARLDAPQDAPRAVRTFSVWTRRWICFGLIVTALLLGTTLTDLRWSRSIGRGNVELITLPPGILAEDDESTGLFVSGGNPQWVVAALGVTLPAALVCLIGVLSCHWRTQDRRLRDVCVYCGHPMSSGERCPECGRTAR